MKLGKKRYLIFIPVCNEEDSIKEVISRLKKYADVADILVIDDGSDDNTLRILKDMESISYIAHDINHGYGATLIEGFDYAIENEYSYVITIDSDKQHQPEEIANFIQLNEALDFDILSGSRYLETDSKDYSKAPEERRKVNKRIADKIRMITGYNLTDSFCGFKLYKVESLKKLDLDEPGYGMPVQLWIQAWKNGLRVKEVPVELIYFENNTGVSDAFKNVFRRYRYYLKTIEKEIKDYENISTRSAS